MAAAAAWRRDVPAAAVAVVAAAAAAAERLPLTAPTALPPPGKVLPAGREAAPAVRCKMDAIPVAAAGVPGNWGPAPALLFAAVAAACPAPCPRRDPVLASPRVETSGAPRAAADTLPTAGDAAVTAGLPPWPLRGGCVALGRCEVDGPSQPLASLLAVGCWCGGATPATGGRGLTPARAVDRGRPGNDPTPPKGKPMPLGERSPEVAAAPPPCEPDVAPSYRRG